MGTNHLGQGGIYPAWEPITWETGCLSGLIGLLGASKSLCYYVLLETLVMLAVGDGRESSGRKWRTGHRVRKGDGERWVLSAPLPLLTQEDP
eukprot:4291851-Pyramimonas_sp.AAC.1